MAAQFIVLSPNAKRRITASVGFVSPQGQPQQVVIVKNKRGWDIPGGHVEAHETPLEAFARELHEEAGCTLLPGASLLAILESVREPTTGIAVYNGMCTLGVFSPTREIEDRTSTSYDELPGIYFGDRELLRKLLSLR